MGVVFRLVAVSEAERRKIFLDMIGDDHPLMKLILQCISNDPHLRPSVQVITKKLAQMVQLFPCNRDYRLLKTTPTKRQAREGLAR